MKIAKKYIYLYIKSILVVFKATKLYTLIILFTIPLQALIPSLQIIMANNIINNIKTTGLVNIMIYIILWGILFIINNLLTPLNTMIQGQLTDKLTYKLNIDLMEKSKTIETIECFENSKFYDDLEIVKKESSWRPVNLLVFGTSVLSNTISLISMLILLSRFNILISFAILIALIPQGLIFYKIQQQAFETLVSNTTDSRKLEYFTSVVLTNEYIKEVRIFNLYDYFKKKYETIFNYMIKNVQKNRIKNFLYSSLFLLITGMISIISFIFVINGIKNNKYEIGAIIIFSNAIIYSITNISRIVEEGSLLYDTLLYMEKYFNFMKIKNNIYIGNKKFNKDFKKIEFKNISFSYPNSEKKVLKDINFSIKNGEKIAIVGENGSGKSTLVKVLCRLYDLKEGNILFDEINYKDFDIQDFRKNLSIIFQDFSKYNLSVEENIILSNLDEKENIEKIKKIISDVNLENLDLEMILGKKFGGTDLSGGQWQKLAISRAFFRNSDILILDEPTASLDPRTEHSIYSDFLKLTENKTVIFVTHRLSTVKKADKVLLIKDGTLIDFDSHDNLYNKNEYYKELYEMQASLY